VANPMPDTSASPGQYDTRVNRRCLLPALLFVLGLAGYACWWNGVELSPLEHQLVGAWGHPQLCSPRDMAVLAGPMTNPYHVIELSPDRVYRFWFASADDLKQRYIIQEGRWRVEKGKLRFEDMPITSSHRLVSDIGWQIERVSGWSPRSLLLCAPHRLWDPLDETFRLAEASRLEIFSEQGKVLTWNRLPGWKR